MHSIGEWYVVCNLTFVVQGGMRLANECGIMPYGLYISIEIIKGLDRNEKLYGELIIE